MKYLRSITLLTILFSLGFSLSVSAQPVSLPKLDTAVAFVKLLDPTDPNTIATRRTALWVKRSDTAAYIMLKASSNPNSQTAFTKIRNLAYLDQTPDGRTLLLGGSFDFISPWNSLPITWTGIISVPTDSVGSPYVLNSVKFLKTAPYSTIRPIGAIDGDHRKWYVAFNSIAAGTAPPLKFYRGDLDSSFNVGGQTADLNLAIDSIGPAPGSFDVPQDWRLSNISVKDGHMIAALTMYPDDPASYKMYLYYWDITAVGGPSWRLNNYKIPQSLLPQKNFSPDTLFGFSVRAISGSSAEVGFVNVSGDPSMKYFSYDYTGAPNLTPNGRTIPRSSIPTTEYFFSGHNNEKYQEHLLSNQYGQHGLAGDVMFSRWDPNKVTFITHESAPNQSYITRDSLSAVYVYDLSQSAGSATKVYNDVTNQELQPQFMLVKGTEWHFPKLSATPSSAVTFGTKDSGAASNAKTIVLTSTEPVATSLVIDSITIQSGKNFLLTGGTTSSTTLAAGTPLTLSLVFKPIDATAGTKVDTIRVYWRDSTQKVMSFGLSGTENINTPPPPKSVHEEDPALFAMTVQPNPFAASARISLTAPEAGSIAIIIHDALGREVYASQSAKIAAGQSHEFTFDAKSLGLPTGTYYVTALLGDRAATREVVFVK